MTLVRTVRDDGYVNVQMVACPYCEEAMDPQASFRQHWRACSHNPAAGSEVSS